MNETTVTDSTLIKLTEYSKGGGCGCKISPKALREILSESAIFPDGNLVVGNSNHDDAAVYDLQNGTALITTTDFFMPIVDDAFSFGKIAAANAISDVYAMGGKPIVAIAILGWPQTIPSLVARRVMAGARETCAEAGIAMAGGHSIESLEPFFGLAVNGIVPINNLKRNNTAKEGDLLFITKPIGIGILSTAQKRKVLADEDVPLLLNALTKLNSIGEAFGQIPEITAMTDVTGFGLAGHLREMSDGSGLTAILEYQQVSIYEKAIQYMKQAVPGSTQKNWNSYGDRITIEDTVDKTEALNLVADPQTNGGLLIAVHPDGVDKVIALMKENGLESLAHPIGKFTAQQQKAIIIK